MPMPNQPPTIRDLYPHLSEAQLKEAEENLDRYFELVLRICERLRLEAEEESAGIRPLTGPDDKAKIQDTESFHPP